MPLKVLQNKPFSSNDLIELLVIVNGNTVFHSYCTLRNINMTLLKRKLSEPIFSGHPEKRDTGKDIDGVRLMY